MTVNLCMAPTPPYLAIHQSWCPATYYLRWLLISIHVAGRPGPKTNFRYAARNTHSRWSFNQVFPSGKSALQTADQFRPIHSALDWLPIVNHTMHTTSDTPPDTVLLTILLPKVAQSSLRFVQLLPETLPAAASELKNLLDMGIIRPSSSTWALPIHMVIKENGEWCPCGDYRWPNDTTIPDWNPLLHIQDFESCLAGKNIYSKIDLLRAYHQIPVNKDDIAKTAIITPFGLF